MAEDKGRGIKINVTSREHIPPLWFIGWLFTIGYVHLASWKVILLAIVIWPYYLGAALR